MSGSVTIVSGTLKGRMLAIPPASIARPTTNRVTENIFNILSHMNIQNHAPFSFIGRRVLDLCAGSGRLGIEALSRGAEHCVFIEKNYNAFKILKNNIQKMSLEHQSTCLQADATICKKDFLACDLIFCDAPYHTDIAENSIDHAFNNDWINKKAIIIIETENVKERFDFSELDYYALKKYGNTEVHFMISSYFSEEG